MILGQAVWRLAVEFARWAKLSVAPVPHKLLLVIRGMQHNFTFSGKDEMQGSAQVGVPVCVCGGGDGNKASRP